MGKDQSLGGTYYSHNRAIILQKGGSLNLYVERGVHECIHALSGQKYKVQVSKNPHWPDKGARHKVEWSTTRLGFASYSRHGSDENLDHFVGFNEGMVQFTARQWLRRNELPSPSGAYLDEVALVKILINKVAEVTRETPKQVFENWEKDQFRGRLMALRDIEKAFGPGALRVLSIYDHLKEDSDAIQKFYKRESHHVGEFPEEVRSEHQKAFFSYFTARTSAEREIIAAQLFEKYGGRTDAKMYRRRLKGRETRLAERAKRLADLKEKIAQESQATPRHTEQYRQQAGVQRSWWDKVRSIFR
jgi:hypothetical protein